MKAILIINPSSVAYPFGIVKLLFSYKWQKIYVRHKADSTGYFVIMANIKYYAGEYEIADKADSKDGLLGTNYGAPGSDLDKL